MDRDSVAKLKLDRRLIGRRGWIGREELDRSLESLPDVGAKSTTLGRAADERGGSDDADEPGEGASDA